MEDDLLGQAQAVLSGSTPKGGDLLSEAMDVFKNNKPDPKFVEQNDRYRQATEYIAKYEGGKKEFGFGLGLRLRRQDMQLPFQGVGNWIARGIGGVENPEAALKKAHEAWDKGEATDNQLALLAQEEYEQQRSKSLGVAGKIGQGIGKALPIASEALAGGGAVKAAGGVIGGGLNTAGQFAQSGRLVGLGQKVLAASSNTPAATFIGRSAQGAATQVAATPLTPGLWFEEAQQRAAENGGSWYEPKNVAAPMAKAAFQNAIMGHLGEATKGLSKAAPAGSGIFRRGITEAGNVVKRGLAGGVAMPLEQAGADALTTLAEKGWKEAGMDEKWATDTNWGYVKQLADPKTRDEGMAALAVTAMTGSLFSAFHGGKADPVKELPKAVEFLKKGGMSDATAATVLKESLSQPPESLPDTPVKAFVEAQQKAQEPPKTDSGEAKPEAAKPVVEPEKAPETKPQEPIDDVWARLEAAQDLRKVEGKGPDGVERRTEDLFKPSEGKFNWESTGKTDIADFEAGGQKFVARFGQNPGGEKGHYFEFRDAEGETKDTGKLGSSAISVFRKAQDHLVDAVTRHQPDTVVVHGEGKRGPMYEKWLESTVKKKLPEYEVYKSGEEIGIRKKAEVPPPEAPVSQSDNSGLNSVKNEVSAQERERLGQPPRPEVDPVGHSFPELREQVLEIGKTDPERHIRLADDLVKNPKPLTDLEDALLLRREVELKAEHGRMKFQLDEARKTDDPEAIAMAEQAESAALAKYMATREAGEASGTLNSRGLNARRMMVRDDYSLANVLYQIEKKGATITKADREQIESMTNKLEDLQKRLDAVEASERRARIDKVLEPNPRLGKRTSKARAEVDAAWEDLRKLTKGKFFSAEAAAGEAIAASARLAKAYVKLGFAKFADFVAEVKTRSSQPMTPEAEALLQNGWDQATAELAAERRSKAMERLKGVDPSDAKKLGTAAKKLYKDFAESGIEGMDARIDAVHAELKQVIPEITREQTMDAISGYGVYRPLTKGQLEAEIRDQKGQMQQLAKLRDLAEGEILKKTGFEQRKPTEAENELIRKVNEAKKKIGATGPDADARLQEYYKNRIEELQKRIDSGDYSTPEKKSISRSEKTSKLEAEFIKTKNELKRKMLEKDREGESRTMKAIRGLGNALDFQRAAFLGLDLPPMLRQGGFVTLGHPVESAAAVKATAKALRSEMGANEVTAELASRDNAKNGMYKRHLKMDPEKQGADEFIQSSWIHDLPIFKPLGKINTPLTKKIAETKGVPVLKNMQRWNDAYLMRLRADRFDAMAAGLSPDGKPTESQADLLGNAVNVFTGRGNIGSMEQSIGYLNKVFLAPKWVVSRFQLATGQPIWHGLRKHGLQPKARLAIAREYARFGVGVGAVYGLVGLAVAAGVKGVSIERDPTSSDFGEIKIRNTRINPLAGLSQVGRFVSRLWYGEAKMPDGSVKPQAIGDTLKNEFRAKLAPVPQTTWTAKEIRDKERGKGKGPPKPYPQTWAELRNNLIVPLTTRDGIKALEDLGIGGIPAWLAGSLGAGLKTYESKK